MSILSPKNLDDDTLSTKEVFGTSKNYHPLLFEAKYKDSFHSNIGTTETYSIIQKPDDKCPMIQDVEPIVLLSILCHDDT